MREGREKRERGEKREQEREKSKGEEREVHKVKIGSEETGRGEDLSQKRAIERQRELILFPFSRKRSPRLILLSRALLLSERSPLLPSRRNQLRPK